ELRGGRDVEAAVVRTVETAGRAIAFSGLAVLIGLSGMWAFGLRVLSSIAAGGTIVVAVSAFAAVTLLPAILGMLGPRVERAPLLHRLAAVPGVARVARVERGPRGSAIDLTPAVSPFTDAGRAVVDRIRGLPGHGPSFLVTGETAGELDFLAQIKGRAPWAA